MRCNGAQTHSVLNASKAMKVLLVGPLGTGFLTATGLGRVGEAGTFFSEPPPAAADAGWAGDPP